MDVFKSLIQPLVGGTAGSSVVDGMKLVVLGGTVETARRVSSSAWSHFVNSFFLTAHFSEEDFPYDWLMLWLSRRPEWQRSREFETTTRTALPGGSSNSAASASSAYRSAEDDDWDQWEVAVSGISANIGGEGGPGEDGEGRPKTRVVFQPTYDTTHTIFYKGHWLRVRRGRKQETGSEMLSISVVARSNAILKQLVLQAKKEYEAEAIHRIQIYFADAHGSWRWTDSRHKRPMASIVLNPGVKEMLLDDARDFLKSEKWYADRGIPFRRGYLLHGVPGSGKSSLIHALAGQLQLDIYVVSLSASWISDNTLTALMGRVPARCVLLLEDLDAAFVRSTNRDDDNNDENAGGNGGNSGGGNGGGGSGNAWGSSGGFGNGDSGRSGDNGNGLDLFGAFGLGSSGGGGGFRSGRRRYGRELSDMNTLSLSGLLNALDGVAASEGRLLFATTNHLERLDPALSRPGRMDVWVEFKNASRWQAEALFRNFFPCEEDEEIEQDLDGVELDDIEVQELVRADEQKESKARRIYKPVDPSTIKETDGSIPHDASSSSSSSSATSSTLWSIATSASSLLNSGSISPAPPPLPKTYSGSPIPTSSSEPNPSPSKLDKSQFGATNTAYLPPPPDASITAKSKTKPLDRKTLAVLAKTFADVVPEEEFSVAGLQGYLLKHKAQPEAAANGVEAWVKSEREMRERLQREKDAREVREQALREKRKKEAQEKAVAKKAQDKKDQELEKVKALLAEKEKEEELAKMRQQLKDKEKEEEERKKKEAEEGEEGEKEKTKRKSKKDKKKEKSKDDKEKPKKVEEEKENDSEDDNTKRKKSIKKKKRSTSSLDKVLPAPAPASEEEDKPKPESKSKSTKRKSVKKLAVSSSSSSSEESSGSESSCDDEPKSSRPKPAVAQPTPSLLFSSSSSDAFGWSDVV